MGSDNTKEWCVYILECGDGSLYTGITNDMDARLSAHKEGVGAKYTRGRGPITLIYTEDCDDRSHASKREYEIKQLSVEEKKRIIGS